MAKQEKIKITPPEMFGAMLAFNFTPAAYLHDSWWQAEWGVPEILENIRQSRSPGGLRQASQYLLEQYGMQKEVDFDFSEEAKQLGLLAGEELQRIIERAGLVLQTQRVVRAIRREDRQRIKDAVGEEGFVFALKRGKRTLDSAGIKQEYKETEEEDIKLTCVRLGMGIMVLAMADLPEAFVRRLQWKLPRGDVEAHWKKPQLDISKENATRLLSILQRETKT
ncbi:MAG: SctK family type III secretion system sorting platform protein [Gammaproteobacteria bacterium]